MLLGRLTLSKLELTPTEHKSAVLGFELSAGLLHQVYCCTNPQCHLATKAAVEGAEPGGTNTTHTGAGPSTVCHVQGFLLCISELVRSAPSSPCVLS